MLPRASFCERERYSNTTDAITGATVRHCYCPLRIHTPYMTVLCTLHVPVTRQTRQPVLRHCYCPLSRQSTVKRHRGEPGHTRDTLGTRGPAGAQGHTDHNDEPHNHPNPPTHNPHVSEPVTRCVPCVSRLCLFTVPVKRHRGQPGHTRDTRDTRTHKGTRTTQTNLTTIQTHQQHTVPVPNSTGKTRLPPVSFYR